MTETALTAALHRRNTGRPPVWMMRQAGRYHSHYQSLKRYDDFISCARTRSSPRKRRWGRSTTSTSTRPSCSRTCCFRSKRWAWACATIRARSSTSICARCADVAQLKGGADAGRVHAVPGRGDAAHARAAAPRQGADRLRRRSVHAVCLCRGGLARECAGRHCPGLTNGVYDAFNEKLLDLLAHNMALQSRGGRRVRRAVRHRRRRDRCRPPTASMWCPCWPMLLQRFRKLDAHTPVTYYSRGTGPDLLGCSSRACRSSASASTGATTSPRCCATLRRSLVHPGQRRSRVAAPAGR